MAQTVNLWGATYSDVPSIDVPSGNSTARFTDASVTTAIEADVAQGKIFIKADGSQGVGTATGGGGSVTQDQDGYIVLPPDGGGSPSVSGLEYETGTWTPSEDMADYFVPFSKTHTELPFFALIQVLGGYDNTTNSPVDSVYFNFESLTGVGVYPSSSNVNYGKTYYDYRASSTTNFSGSSVTITTPLSSSDDSTSSTPRFWVTEAGLYFHSRSASRFWRAGKQYKWIAVWAPTT